MAFQKTLIKIISVINKNNFVICDDLMSQTADNQKIADLFSEGSHHRIECTADVQR